MTLCMCRYKAFQFKKEKEKSKPKGSRRKTIKLICLMKLMKVKRGSTKYKIGSLKNLLKKTCIATVT